MDGADTCAIASAHVVINQRPPGDPDNILDQQLVHHAAGGSPGVQTVAEVKDDLDDFLAGFSDIHITINLIVADGSCVVEDCTATGTQGGPFQGRRRPASRSPGLESPFATPAP